MPHNFTDEEKAEYEKLRQKSEKDAAAFKQKLEEKAIRNGGTAGELEIPVKTVPSSPDLNDPSLRENDGRVNPERNPALKK